MKSIITPKTFLSRLPGALLVIGLSGCTLPYYHTTTRSEFISGRIIDSKTGAPIIGATIKPRFASSPNTISDSSGHFDLPRSVNELKSIAGFAPCSGGAINQDGAYFPSYLATKSGYVPVEFGLHGVEKEDVVDKNKKKATYQHFLVGNIPLSAGDSQTPVKFQR